MYMRHARPLAIIGVFVAVLWESTACLCFVDTKNILQSMHTKKGTSGKKDTRYYSSTSWSHIKTDRRVLILVFFASGVLSVHAPEAGHSGGS